MGEIAEKAGLGRETVYHYYHNKMDLLENLLQDAFQEAKRIIDETIHTDPAPEVRLEKYARAKLQSWG